MKDPHGQTSYEWDRLHRLKKVIEPDTTKWISYQYDWNNNRTKMTDHIESTSKDTLYEYNTRGFLWKLTDRNTGVTTYAYNDDGSLATMTYPNGVVATYTYNPYRGWLTSLNHMSGSTLIAGFTYEYNPTYWGKNGTRTAMIEDILLPNGTDRIQARVDYEYDALYRLTRELRAGSYAYDKNYTYDRNGNRLTMDDGATTYYHYDMASKLGDYGSVDTPGSPSNTRLTYDGAGNTETITPPTGPVTTYAWDWNNKLTAAKQGTTTIAQFAYDGDGIRTSATFGSGTAQFLYDGDKLIAELDGQGAITAFYTIGPDGTISRLVASGGPMFYHGDGLASVKAATGATPVTITDAYAYDAWGNCLDHVGSTQQPYQFVGGLGYYTHYQNSDFRLLQLGARYYDASVGRFTSMDPIRFRSGMNLYTYVNNRPVISVDPSGLYGGGNAAIGRPVPPTYEPPTFGRAPKFPPVPDPDYWGFVNCITPSKAEASYAFLDCVLVQCAGLPPWWYVGCVAYCSAINVPDWSEFGCCWKEYMKKKRPGKWEDQIPYYLQPL